jgi:NitT/TauT family transport system ATP-binding protein
MNTPADTSGTVLNIAGLTFSYEGSASWGLRNLSLIVARQEIAAILGASGCGKSTLLNLIAGLLKANSGTIDLPGRIGYIFQDDALFPWRTVQKNLMLAAEINNSDSSPERIAQYLRTFHLKEEILKQYPSELSGGMRQRVSIIQSLMFNPELLLLDEPFSALDFYTKLSLESEFYQLVKERGKAAILVTHDIEEAIAMSDRVLIMGKDGTLTRQFKIDLGDERLPENARGSARFAELYNSIWSELRLVIAE